MSEEESNAYKVIQEIFSAIVGSPVSYAVLQKQMREIFGEFTKFEIRRCMEDNQAWLSSKVSSMEFDSDYIAVRYIAACVRNALRKRTPVEYETNADIEAYEIKYVPRQRKKCLQSYIDEY